jgi:hypothetical protein
MASRAIGQFAQIGYQGDATRRALKGGSKRFDGCGDWPVNTPVVYSIGCLITLRICNQEDGSVPYTTLRAVYHSHVSPPPARARQVDLQPM